MDTEWNTREIRWFILSLEASFKTASGTLNEMSVGKWRMNVSLGDTQSIKCDFHGKDLTHLVLADTDSISQEFQQNVYVYSYPSIIGLVHF